MSSVRVGLVGGGFMAKTHSLAYRGAAMLYGDALPAIAPVRVADVLEPVARAAAARYGWSESTTDWRATATRS